MVRESFGIGSQGIDQVQQTVAGIDEYGSGRTEILDNCPNNTRAGES